MFCYQCQETLKGIGCNKKMGVCGKSDEVAILQDLLIYSVKELSKEVYEKKINTDLKMDEETIKALFMTITNANFDEAALISQIDKMEDLNAGITGIEKNKFANRRRNRIRNQRK